MEHILGQEWEITPAGGATGEAFYAKNEDQRLFLKRNSSPFLAVLSAEGIVPKLVWTKRLENGDVITAQQWLEGRELKPSEMDHELVAKLLKKIHRSEPMLGMLSRLEKTPINPEDYFRTVMKNIDGDVRGLPVVEQAIRFLIKEAENVDSDEKVVCHGDLNHNNWLLDENNQLYLIDWDGASIADPAMDLGMLLYWYIPKENWEDWLQVYGQEINEHLKLRMKWYVTLQTISSIQWYKDKHSQEEMDKWISFLLEIMSQEN
ncbi:phosphotransferase family protein [Neobacillus dielmonensis]|uniref:phosphotransferase family protein n=1 Tax=Neobacillus dielmonensis TaxID=1347369 RepID=UPI0005A7590C|nr:phosphotransferase family protein [Neobacillus dielmonensis]